jgi:hypothetical protein
MMRLCKEALACGPKTTRELALIVIAAKGLDTSDKVLARAMATRMIHAPTTTSGPRGESEGRAGLGPEALAS